MSQCAECGNTLRPTSGPGRTMSYRGQEGYQIPDDVTSDNCDQCGAVWMDGPQLDRLSDDLERQRKERLKDAL
jgi:Zn-finger nucleic acid-binding protein